MAEKHDAVHVRGVDCLCIVSSTPRNVGAVPDINFHSHTAMQLLWLVSMNSNSLHLIVHCRYPWIGL